MVGPGGDFVQGLGEEIDVRGIVGRLENDEIVAARIVAIDQVAVALVVAMKGVANGVAELRLDVLPIIEGAVNDDAARARWPRAARARP